MRKKREIKKELSGIVVPDGTDMKETMYVLGWYDALNYVLDTKEWRKTQNFLKFKLACQRAAEKEANDTKEELTLVKVAEQW